jgi:hypothetical protein
MNTWVIFAGLGGHTVHIDTSYVLAVSSRRQGETSHVYLSSGSVIEVTETATTVLEKIAQAQKEC